MFESKPTTPKYTVVWDVAKVLKHLDSFGPPSDVDLKMCLHYITLRLNMILLLLSGQRCQTIHCLELKGINMNELHCKIMVPSLLKQSRPGYHLKPLEFEPYENKNLCVLSNLRQYICKTKDIRNNEQKLFISYKKPHKHVSKATIYRWCKEILFCAGIDVKRFGPHSVRAASTSFAKEIDREFTITF